IPVFRSIPSPFSKPQGTDHSDLTRGRGDFHNLFRQAACAPSSPINFLQCYINEENASPSM
ncbi:MAG TPA: hypothetical protein PKW21_03595, partial [Rhabdaerophilum sp.]|nr:hypothetical protein [Rhabdaerophilum sp.]